MARSLVAPDSSDGVAPAVEANSERVHGAASEDPWVAPALSGGVGAAPGSTDNQAQIVSVVPPSSRQLLITDLGLEPEAMRFAIRGPLLNFIGWPEYEDLVFVCRNCYDWKESMAELRWRRLVRKLLPWIFKRRIMLERKFQQDEIRDWNWTVEWFRLHERMVWSRMR